MGGGDEDDDEEDLREIRNDDDIDDGKQPKKRATSTKAQGPVLTKKQKGQAKEQKRLLDEQEKADKTAAKDAAKATKLAAKEAAKEAKKVEKEAAKGTKGTGKSKPRVTSKARIDTSDSDETTNAGVANPASGKDKDNEVDVSNGPQADPNGKGKGKATPVATAGLASATDRPFPTTEHQSLLADLRVAEQTVELHVAMDLETPEAVEAREKLAELRRRVHEDEARRIGGSGGSREAETTLVSVSGTGVAQAPEEAQASSSKTSRTILALHPHPVSQTEHALQPPLLSPPVSQTGTVAPNETYLSQPPEPMEITDDISLPLQAPRLPASPTTNMTHLFSGLSPLREAAAIALGTPIYNSLGMSPGDLELAKLHSSSTPSHLHLDPVNDEGGNMEIDDDQVAGNSPLSVLPSDTDTSRKRARHLVSPHQDTGSTRKKVRPASEGSEGWDLSDGTQRRLDETEDQPKPKANTRQLKRAAKGHPTVSDGSDAEQVAPSKPKPKPAKNKGRSQTVRPPSGDATEEEEYEPTKSKAKKPTKAPPTHRNKEDETEEESSGRGSGSGSPPVTPPEGQSGAAQDMAPVPGTVRGRGGLPRGGPGRAGRSERYALRSATASASGSAQGSPAAPRGAGHIRGRGEAPKQTNRPKRQT